MNNGVSLNDASKQKVTFNQSVNVKYASNPTISTSLNSLPSAAAAPTANQPTANKLTSSSALTTSTTTNQKPASRASQLSNKLTTNPATGSQPKPLKSSNLINQLRLFKLSTAQQPKTSELNRISNHNQHQAQKMRTLTSTASEKNLEFKSKYGNLNKTSTTSLLNKPAKTKPGTVVDEKVTVTHKGTFDSGPVLASTTVNKSLDHYKLPYGKGENVETDEFGEQSWRHKNVRAYEEKTSRKVRQEFDVPASAVVKRLNESAKLDKNNNNEQGKQSSSAARKYMYGMNLSGGGAEQTGSQALVLHSSANKSSNHSPFKESSIAATSTTAKLSSSGKYMIDKAIQCELKKSKSAKERFAETGWKHYVEEPEEPKFREFSGDKWYYDKYEFEPGELVAESSRQVEGIGAHHQVHKWTKKINPASIEQKVETQKKVNTEYHHNLSGSFKVIKPDRNGTVSTYVKPVKNLGVNSAGQQVISHNKAGEVIYSQVDKSKKRMLRDQMQTPLPGYPDSDYDDDELELKKQSDAERPRSALKNANRLSSRSPSPVSRSRMICLNIPNEKQKAKLHRERSMSPQLIYYPPRSSSTGPRVIRNRTYQAGYAHPEQPIEPPPQFATLGHKLPPKAPSSLHRSSSAANQHVRRIPIEADSKLYYQTEQSNLSDQSSVFALKKNRETLEETMSFASSGSEFVDGKGLGHSRIADSTIRELDKKKKQISYDNQVIRHPTAEVPTMANSVWYKSLDEDYRKGMAANEICLPSLPNYSGESKYFATMDNKKKSSSSKKESAERQAYTLDKRYLEERKKGILTSSSDKENKLIKSSISRRPTQQASDFVDSSGKAARRMQFSSTRDLTQSSSDKQKQRSASLTRYQESESDASIASANHVHSRSGYRALAGLNYPLKPVTRSASMHNGTGMLNHPSSLLRKHSAIRSTESDHGYPTGRPVSRAMSTTRFNASGQPLMLNDPVVLYLPAIDNSLKELNTLSKSKSSDSKKLGNKKLAASVNNLSSVSRTNSVLSKLKTPATSSKKDLSKSTDKLNEMAAKLNNYQNSKTLASQMTNGKSKEIKRSQSIPKNAKLDLLTKIKNKLKSKD